MKTPVHKISIINSNGVWFDISNVGDEKNIPIGLESIQINKTKDDYSQECVITIASKYDLNSVVGIENNDGKYKYTNQLPTNTEGLLGPNGYDNRYGHFDYEIGDMVYVQFGYNEDKSTPEGFFGFVKTATVINDKKVVITIQNHAYLLKKTMYNFSQKEIKIEELYKKVVDNYNIVFKDVYGSVLSKLSATNSQLSAILKSSGEIDPDNLIINVSYTMKNFRTENSTSVDILDMIQEKYFTRTNFFQFYGGKTYLLGGFFNLLSLQEEDLPDDLKKKLDLNFVFKNYDLKYERFGLDNNHIDKKIREEDSTLTPDDYFSFQYVLGKSLNWQEDKDVKININFKVSDRKNSEFKEVSYGDKGGEAKTIVYYESKTNDELKNLAEEYIKKFKYTGYKKGSTISAFGYPNATVFDNMFIVEVYQNNLLNSSEPYVLIIQKYNVDAVNLTYNSTGIKQTINVGQLLSSNIKSTKGKGSEAIFKAETTSYTEPIAVGTVPVIAASAEDLTDYQLLNQIDINNTKINDNQSELILLKQDWEKATADLNYTDLSSATQSTLGVGFSTTTKDIEKVIFERLPVPSTASAVVDFFTGPDNPKSIKDDRELQDFIEIIYDRTRVIRTELNELLDKNQKYISEAKAKGTDVGKREIEYKNLVSLQGPAKNRINFIVNFTNK